MTFLSRIIFLSFPVLGLSCNSKGKTSAIPINQQIANEAFHGKDKVILVSCVRCNCFLTSLTDLYHKDSLITQQFFITSDTSCTQLPFITHHVSQSKIDEISEQIYNVILFKKEGAQYVARIVETDESRRLGEIIRKYFN